MRNVFSNQPRFILFVAFSRFTNSLGAFHVRPWASLLDGAAVSQLVPVCFPHSGVDVLLHQLPALGRGPVHGHLPRFQRPLLLHAHTGSHHRRLLAGQIQVSPPMLHHCAVMLAWHVLARPELDE